MYTCYIQSFKILASFCGWAGWFECYLVKNPIRDIFLQDVAQFYSSKVFPSYPNLQLFTKQTVVGRQIATKVHQNEDNY